MMEMMNQLRQPGEMDPFRVAINLAMTDSIEEEKAMIDFFGKYAFRCVATLISGNDAVALRKVIGNVIGAGLNANLIERKKSHIHPLAHAVQEAVLGTRLDSSVSQNCRLKIGVVRKDYCLAVAIYGDLGFHEFSSHKTIGGGFQYLGGE